MSIWSLGTHRTFLWTQEEEDAPLVRPYLTLLIDETAQKVLDELISDELPRAGDLIRLLENSLRNYRTPPQRLKVVGAMADMRDFGLYARQHHLNCTMSAASTVRAHALAERNRAWETEQHGAPRSSLLEHLGPELTTSLFKAADFFWENECWRQLPALQFGKMREKASGVERYFMTLGTGGQEYGVLLFRNYDLIRAMMEGSPVESDQEPSATLLFQSEFATAFPDIDFVESNHLPRPEPDQWPRLMRVWGQHAPLLPTRQETALLLACIFSLSETPASEWTHVELPEPFDALGLEFSRSSDPTINADSFAPNWMEQWPKQTATARKIAVVMLEHVFNEQVTEKTIHNLWMLGFFWCQEVTRFSYKRLLELGSCEEQVIGTFPDVDVEAYRADWAALEAYLKALA